MKKGLFIIGVLLLLGCTLLIGMFRYNKMEEKRDGIVEREANFKENFYNIDESVISFGEHLDVRFSRLANYKYKMETVVNIINKDRKLIKKVKIEIPYLETTIKLEKDRSDFTEYFEGFTYFHLYDLESYETFQNELSENIELNGTKLTFIFEDNEREEHILRFDLQMALAAMNIEDFDVYLNSHFNNNGNAKLENYFDQLYYTDLNLYQSRVMEFRECLERFKMKKDKISPIYHIYFILRYDEYLSSNFYEMVVKDLKQAYYQNENVDETTKFRIVLILKRMNTKLHLWNQEELEIEDRKLLKNEKINIDKFLGNSKI